MWINRFGESNDRKDEGWWGTSTLFKSKIICTTCLSLCFRYWNKAIMTSWNHQKTEILKRWIRIIGVKFLFFSTYRSICELFKSFIEFNFSVFSPLMICVLFFSYFCFNQVVNSIWLCFYWKCLLLISVKFAIYRMLTSLF